LKFFFLLSVKFKKKLKFFFSISTFHVMMKEIPIRNALYTLAALWCKKHNINIKTSVNGMKSSCRPNKDQSESKYREEKERKRLFYKLKMR
jgi:hypothetical protein